MEYQLSKVIATNLAYTNKDNVFGVDVIITTKIVGQEYTGFQNSNISFCPLEETDNFIDVKNKINAYAKSYVEENYPNSK
jgi:hypothetical protein